MRLAATMLSASIAAGSFMIASGDSHDTTYYACLYGGSLTQVNTTGPTSCGRGTPISWNATGPAGETGPSGIATVLRREIDLEVLGEVKGSYAYCHDGEILTGGGFHDQSTTVQSSVPLPASYRPAYFASFHNETSEADDVQVFALCAASGE